LSANDTSGTESLMGAGALATGVPTGSPTVGAETGGACAAGVDSTGAVTVAAGAGAETVWAAATFVAAGVAAPAGGLSGLGTRIPHSGFWNCA
jgi:hypothetical protein